MSSVVRALVAGAALLSGGAQSVSISPHALQQRDAVDCAQLQIKLHVKAQNYKLKSLRVDSNFDAVEWMQDTDAADAPGPLERVLGPLPVEADLETSAQLCVPRHGQKADILQIASHGATYDKRYWDSEFKPDEYSYVAAALRAGYSILTYDRLGNGNSSKPDGYDVVQIPAQTAILQQLTLLAKSGELLQRADVLRGTVPESYTAARVVQVGHSLGSFLVHDLIAHHPTASDAAVLTGWMAGPRAANPPRGSFALQYAPEAVPGRLDDRGSGYMVVGGRTSYQYLFLADRRTFEPGALEYYWDIRGTLTAGEQFSSGAAIAQAPTAPGFAGPLLVFTGELDRAFCPTYTCEPSVDLGYLRDQYPDAKDVSVYLQPETGHLLTSSFNATAGYRVIFDWLDSQGL